MRTGGWVLAVGLWLHVASTAYATETDSPSPKDLQLARDLFKEAEGFEARSEWTEALSRLERAVQIKATGGLRFHIAFCKENLGRYRDALRDYEAAERLGAQEKKDEVVRAVREALERARSGPKVKVTSQVLDAELRIDEESVTLGATELMNVGRHTVHLEAKGYEAYNGTFSVTKQDPLTVLDIPLQKAEVDFVATRARAQDVTPAQPRSKTWPIVTTSAAIAFGAGGVVTFVLAANAETSGSRCRVIEPGTCDDARNRVHLLDWTTAGLWGASIALGITSAILWSKGSTQAAVGANGIHLRGTF